MIQIILLTIAISTIGFYYPSLLAVLGMQTYRCIFCGKMYKYITNAFVHATPLHLFSNITIIIFMACKCLPIVGNCTLGIFYILFVLLASIFSIVDAQICSKQTHVGASGGAYGLVIYSIAIGVPTTMPLPIIAGVILLLMFAEMRINKGFANHLGGASAGLLAGLLYTGTMHNHTHIIAVALLAIGLVALLLFKINLTQK